MLSDSEVRLERGVWIHATNGGEIACGLIASFCCADAARRLVIDGKL
jgi:hypothetical protein